MINWSNTSLNFRRISKSLTPSETSSLEGVDRAWKGDS